MLEGERANQSKLELVAKTEVAEADPQTRKKVPGCGPEPCRGSKQREAGCRRGFTEMESEECSKETLH
ncbi:hypothetical protein HPP92_020456 [Vanilla planifolia]|uniref:Uncharacterized protein n=1 Tax=Vanilla planifolia TaxID=51239 RepID=A0A835UIG8_VANPL|nr:hypothetical protein HPP92_020456 [Vanilla planifolia]